MSHDGEPRGADGEVQDERGEGTMENVVARRNAKLEKSNVGERIEHLAWALFFLMSGGILLVPGFPNPWGAWLIGTGAILVGSNLSLYALRAHASVFVTGCGVIAIVAGVAEYASLDLPILAMGLLLVGVVILLAPVIRRNARTV